MLILRQFSPLTSLLAGNGFPAPRFRLLLAALTCALGALLFPTAEASESGRFERCLLDLLRKPENGNLTVVEVNRICRLELAAQTTTSAGPGITGTMDSLAINDDGSAQALFSGFFEPYKETYFIAGSMRGEDGYVPFSGKTADIKFALGLKFGLFPNVPAFDKLAPLYFGYSQQSWWDIAESSGPFREHNYNPEIFWDYAKTSNRNGFNFVGQFIDRIGFEHQSNGRDGRASRSWDRLYLRRNFQLADNFAIGIKAWKDVNNEEFNKDITDFLGNFELSASFQPNERLAVNVNARQGWETSKLSYQLDLIYRIPEWVNSQFMLSYYEGYGEALISYNEKTSSLRAGLFFPISFNGN